MADKERLGEGDIPVWVFTLPPQVSSSSPQLPYPMAIKEVGSHSRTFHAFQRDAHEALDLGRSVAAALDKTNAVSRARVMD